MTTDTRKDTSSQYDNDSLRWPLDFINVKCIIFTLIMAAMYWYRDKLSMAAVVFMLFTMIMWYNSAYECQYANIPQVLFVTVLITCMIYVTPKRNKVVLAFFLYVPYFALAWYDYLTNCRYRMNPTIFPYGRYLYLPMKPDPYKQRYDELDPTVKEKIVSADHYITVSIFLFILIYVVTTKLV